jgi:hypothetical protein
MGILQDPRQTEATTACQGNVVVRELPTFIMPDSTTGLGPGRSKASIRFSLGKQNAHEDVDFVLGLVPETVVRLRDLSPEYHRVRV